MQIGHKIKTLRQSQGMTLTQLAKHSGVQIATLSRMENGKMTGTLDSHQNIAAALGIELVELYKNLSSSEQKSDFQPQPAAYESFTYNDKASYEILTNRVLSRKMMPIVLRVEPGGRTNIEKYQAGAERFIFILKGDVRVYIEEDSCKLNANQSLYIDASKRHWFENTDEGAAKIISVITPVSL